MGVIAVAPASWQRPNEIDALARPGLRLVSSEGLVRDERRSALSRRGRLVRSLAVVAMFVGLWAATGALVSGRSGSLVRLPGSIAVKGGYLYVAKNGDSLWSIATRLQPQGDPRAIVARLQAELKGAPLESGAKLILP